MMVTFVLILVRTFYIVPRRLVKAEKKLSTMEKLKHTQKETEKNAKVSRKLTSTHSAEITTRYLE